MTRGLSTDVRPEPSFRMLCVMAHHVLDRIREHEHGAVVDALKWEIARANLTSPPPHYLTAVADAVLLARAKGYGTPRLLDLKGRRHGA